MNMRKPAIVVLAVLLATTGCHAPQVAPATAPAAAPFQTLVSDRLYFGRNIPDGGVVSDADWEAFLAEVITPRFPAGLTVLRGRGQWRDASAVIHREDSVIVDLLHSGDAASEKAVLEIMAAYKTRFRQEAILRVRDSVAVQFW
jgi:hypothetical protein